MCFPYVNVSYVVVVVVVVVKSGAERKQEGEKRRGRKEQLRQKSNNPNLKGGEKIKIQKPTQIQELQLRDPVQSIRHGRIIVFFFCPGSVDLKFTSVFAF